MSFDLDAVRDTSLREASAFFDRLTRLEGRDWHRTTRCPGWNVADLAWHVAGVPAFYADIAACYRDEIRSLGEGGCTYLQLDDTNLAYLCDTKMRDGARARACQRNLRELAAGRRHDRRLHGRRQRLSRRG